MMMSVKAACAQAAGAAKNSLLNASSNKSFKGCDCNASVAPKNAAGITAASTNANTIFENSNSSTTTPTMYDYHNLSHVAHNYSRTDAEADAAAAALLKELEEEEEAKIVQSSKKTANKSKKKKQQNKVISKAQTTSSGVASTNTKSSTVTLMADVDDKSNFAHGKSNKNAPNSPPTTNDKFSQQQQTSDKDKSSNDDEDSEHEMERTLVSFIDTSDVDGIEAFLASIKGVPGRALLRKNAKKALKRMKEENPGSGAECHLTTNNNLPFTASTNALPSSRLSYRKDDDNPDTRIGSPQPKLDASSSNQYVENSKVKKMEETAVKMASSNTASANTNAVASSNKLSLPSVSSSKAVTTAVSSNIHRPLLKVVKQTTITSNGSNSPSPFNNPNTSHSNKQNQYPGGRAECVMHMSPVIIGWVIGKGGQRIRDIMEEASARIWIDQNENNIQVDGYRVVYVSGGKKNVETAIKLLKDLISKAPINNNCNNASGNPDSNKSSSAFPPASSANLASESNKVTINKSSGSSGPVPSMSSHAITPGIAPTSAWGKAASTTTVASRPLHGGSAQAEDTGRSASMAASSAATSLLASGENNAVVAEYTQVVQCEPRFVALLIGRRGWTVKHIQDESGARVDIDQTVTPRIIRISGSSENQVTMATQMVRDVLSYPDAQLHYGDSSISNEKTIHRMLDQQKYNSALVTTAHKEQQFLLTALEHPVQGNALHAVAGAAVKANVGSLLPPLPPDAHQEQFVGDGKQQGSNSESSSSSFDRSVSWQASSSYLQHAPPPGYAPAVTASHTATTSSMPLTPDAVRLERDMRTTTQSVLAGLYSPTDDDKRNSIGTSSSNTTVDSSWPQSALANLSINKNNSFANPSPLFKVQENQNAVSHRGEHDTGTALVGGSVWSSQVCSSSAYLGLSESRHHTVPVAGSDSPFYESPKIHPPASYQQNQSSLTIQQQPMIATSTSTRKYSRMMELFSIPDNTVTETQTSEESDRRVSMKDKMNYSTTNASLTSSTIASHSSSSTWKSSNNSASENAFTAVSSNCGTATSTDHLWTQEPKSLLTTPSSFGLQSHLPFSSGLVVPCMNNDKQNFQSIQPFYSRGTHDRNFINDDSVLFPGINHSTAATRNINSSVSGYVTSGLQKRISPDVSSGDISTNHNPLWSRGLSNLSNKSLNEGSDTIVSNHDNCGPW